jgi:outer membrane lipopolysaccharide assembly protein LptE/RlpB
MKTIILVLACLALSGCSFNSTQTVPVLGHVPSISEPVRPKLLNMDATELAAYQALPEPLRKKLQDNDTALKVYAEQCIVSIKEYNGFAKFSNQRSNAWVGIPATKDEKVPEVKP